MRSIPSALQAKLDSGATTLARCWIVRRRDGVVLGFTDHDRDLAIGSVACRAGTGFTGSEATSRFDLAVDGLEISGAFSDDVLTEADLAAGRYDAAEVTTWLVDWSDVSLKILIARGTMGEVRREGSAFTAELRGLADALAQDSGRLFTARCGVDLGDSKCRVDLTSSTFRGSGAVTALEGTSIVAVSNLNGFADGWFTAGRLAWTGGANAGVAVEVKQHRVVAGEVRLSLWRAMAEPIAVGDGFTITAGCDKSFATCRDRFANTDNFRGFPQIPGNDFVVSYPLPGSPDNGNGTKALF
ncbi:DUF2163 domain-containing protein [Nitrobacter sp. NHB1]|uniref:DUF2163 domain-containing protein n=1 Tax=Nitrobacter sp. NHB1 TaxID=3119830 RepID=UPI002FFE1F51